MKTIDVRGILPKHPTKKYSRRSIGDISIITIHHSLTTTGSPEAFARYHVESNGWPGIAYHYVIGKDGTVYVTNDLETISYHVGDSNKKSIGICLVGDFRTEKPSEAQYKAAIELVRYLLHVVKNAAVKGHSELPGYDWKACPVINMDQFREDIKEEPKMEPIPQWKMDALKQMEDLGIYTKGAHKPEEPVDKGFLAAVIANVLRGL